MKSKNICKFPPSNFLNEFNISLFVLETDKATMMETVVLQSCRMILVEQGEGIFSIDGVSYPISAGTLIFGFENESFRLTDGTDVQYFYIDFSGQRGHNLCARFGIYPATRMIKKQNGLIPFCRDCLLSTPQEHIDLAAESVLLYVFSRLTNANAAQNSLLQSIIDLTNDSLSNPDLSISLVAKELGYNAKYLSHFFKEKMNVCYSEYLSSIRFKYAISLFEHGLNSIKNVAFLCGYSDPLYFSKSFKKAIGVSPKEYISRFSDKD